MYLDVYIGDLDDPNFKWDGGDWNGNAPKRKSPFFPPSAPLRALKKAIEQGEFEGKQADWGAWVAKATKEQIVAFIERHYPPDWHEKQMAHIQSQMDDLMQYVAGLTPGKQYALVASEL